MSACLYRRVVLVLALVAALGAGGCRRAQAPSRRGSAGRGGDAPAATSAAGGDRGKPLVQEAEPDWAGLSDEEVAQRSAITPEECRLPLAEGEGILITVCDFVREVNALPPRYRARYDSLERRKELLEDMISLAVMEQEAKRLGIDRAPETQYYVEKLLADRMEERLQRELRRQIQASITAQDEQAYYEAHREQYNRPELAQVAQIVVATEQEARDLIVQLAAPDAEPGLFDRLAAERSLDARTRDRGGRLAYFTRPDVSSDRYRPVDRAIAEAAFSMQRNGDVHPDPIQTSAGWHVLKLTGKRAAVTRSLDQVRSTVRSTLLDERFQAAWAEKLEQIVAEMGVEVHPENLGDVHPDVPSPDELRRLHDEAHGFFPPPPSPPPAPPVAPSPPPSAPRAPAPPVP
jgi:peptidyl-prolyl cis-trans isomerase C